MDIMELLKTRRTYRRFEQKAISDEILEDIVEQSKVENSTANDSAGLARAEQESNNTGEISANGILTM